MCRWPRQPGRTAAGARGLYLHQPTGTMLWDAPDSGEPLDHPRLTALLDAPDLAAEAEPPFDVSEP